MTVSPVRSGFDKRQRLAWLDNLRIVIIAGMILTHVGTAYVVDIGWYYEERTASAATQAVFWALLGVGGLFAMGLLFLVAGLVTPGSLGRRGPAGFARGRLVRLGIPLVVFLAVADPLLDLVGYRGEGGQADLRTFLSRWWRYDADLSVMWFVAVLLVFSLGYAVLRWRRPGPSGGGRLTARPLVLAGLAVAVGSFVVRLRWPFMSDSVRGLNLWELPQMLALFSLGVAAGERGWLDGGLSDALWRRCGQVALAAGAATVLLAPMIALGEPDAFLGGLEVRAMLLPLVEGVIAVSMSLWVLEWFRRRWDIGGRLQREAARASFAAYVVHPAVLVALMVALASAPVGVEVKLVVVWVLGVIGSFGLGWLATRSRVLGRVL
jgi:glucans biosynthesis protein C